jgi:hypothetical protein
MLPHVAMMSLVAGALLYISRRIFDQAPFCEKYYFLQDETNQLKAWVALASMGMGILMTTWFFSLAEYGSFKTMFLVMLAQIVGLVILTLIVLAMWSRDMSVIRQIRLEEARHP